MKSLIGNLLLEKKYKYALQGLIVSSLLTLFSFSGVVGEAAQFGLVHYLVAGCAFILISTVIVQYPNITWDNYVMTVIMPINIFVGIILTLLFFPNLSAFFKFFIILSYFTTHYIISSVDNIFLVVEDREGAIPLYRVAQTWSQILLVVVALPLFTGIYKFTIISPLQSLIVSLLSIIFLNYLFWTMKFDKDAKKTSRAERLSLYLLVAFIVFCTSTAVSFVPTETFLKGLYMAGNLMFGLTYVYSYLKNEITKSLVVQYTGINLIFLLILLAFGA